MTEYNLRVVLDALKEADKAGATEDATRLAQIAERLSTQPTQTPPKKPSSAYQAKGIATSLGAPVDLFASGFRAVGLGSEEPFGGSKSIERGFRAIGVDIPEGPPKDVGEHAHAAVGEAAGMLIPAMGAFKLLTRGAGLVANISRQIFGTMVKHPAATITAEVTGGIGLGVGRKIGEEHPALSPAIETVGGIAGGLVPSALAYTPTRLALRTGKWALGKMSIPFTEAGAKYRAGDFLKKQVADPAEVSTILREGSISGMPPVAMTGEKRLMALYNHIKDLNPINDARAIEQINKAAFKLQQEMKILGEGSTEILRAITEKRIASIELGMDNRVMQGVARAKEKIDSIPIAQRYSQESIVVRNELTKVMHQERELVKEIWKVVPKKILVGVEKTKSTMAKTLEEIPSAQRTDIPAVLNKHIVFEENIKSTTINEMQGLRSKLLETSRQARANSRWNKARIAEDMADAILEDITLSAGKTTTPEGELLKTALAATRQFKQRFEQGTPGKILGYERTSAPSIAPELTLDIATSGKGVVDINKVVVTQEAREATERYMARSFTDYSLDKAGVVDTVKAKKWVRNNEEILDSFPDLRNQLTDATEAQSLATATKATMDARRAALRDPNISVAAEFIGADVGEEIKRILKSPNTVFATNQLVKQAGKDTTGKALGGLRGGFIEHILDSSSIGAFNDIGERTLSGKAMLGFINHNGGVLREVFSRQQIFRMNKVGQELARLETLGKTRGMEIEYSDAVSNILKFASRFGGAAVGRHWGKMVGAGGTVQIPGFFAQNWYKITSKLTKNRFENLVHDAIMSPDGKLLETLLMPINKPGSRGLNEKEVGKRLNAWLLAEGNRVLQDIVGETSETTSKTFKAPEEVKAAFDSGKFGDPNAPETQENAANILRSQFGFE